MYEVKKTLNGGEIDKNGEWKAIIEGTGVACLVKGQVNCREEAEGISTVSENRSHVATHPQVQAPSQTSGN